ncbi:MAG: SPOR domain-containing protein [Candidatus Omnitrophica bacterium]|nr:SPOR domain-containing protein [Candidatus Omnitrophota bacterium]
MKKKLFSEMVFAAVWSCVIFAVGPPAYADLKDIEASLLNRDYIGAQKLAQDTLASDPGGSVAQKAQYYLGLSQLEQAKYKEALESFGKVSRDRLDPQLRDRLYLGTFDAHYLLEEYEKADATLQGYLKESRPQALSLVYLKLAKANLKLANWARATEYLEKIVRSFSNSLEVPAARQLLEEKHYFAVQAGAFQDRRLAESLVDELKQKQEYAYIVETVDQKNNKFYRVRVGQLSMLKDAQSLKLRLAKLGYPAQIYP